MNPTAEHRVTPLTFERIGAALALCTAEGELVQVTPEARRLLERFGMKGTVGASVQTSLWTLLEDRRLGEQVEWQQHENDRELLGVSRYPAGDAHYLLMMREVTDQREEMARRLHRQRLESVGRLVASVSHDLRTVASSIVYNSEVLSRKGHALDPAEYASTLREIAIASQHLSTSVDSLLGYARLGPQVGVPVSVETSVGRAMALLRRQYRESEHTLEVDIRPDASHVVANPILVDQILVNLLLNAAESTVEPIHVKISTARVGPDVEIRVADEGPGVPEATRAHLFRPFFTTKQDSSGVGLTVAREAARELGGELEWAPSEVGACFVLTLPAHTPAASMDAANGQPSSLTVSNSANR